MTPEQSEALRKPFPAAAVGKLPKPYKAESPKGNCRECGGFHGLPAVHLDYVGHAAVTDRLREVDPEWSWEPFAVDERGLPALDNKGNLWIRLTVGGTTRIGVGDGRNAKEVIGDAIRNAAMRFGVALDLWAKEDLHAMDEERGTIEPQPVEQAPKPATRTMSRTPKAKPVESEPKNGTLPIENGEQMTEKQLGMLMPLFIQAGVRSQERRHEYAERIIERPLEKSTDMTKTEASRVIDALLQDVRDLPPQDEEPPY